MGHEKGSTPASPILKPEDQELTQESSRESRDDTLPSNVEAVLTVEDSRQPSLDEVVKNRTKAQDLELRFLRGKVQELEQASKFLPVAGENPKNGLTLWKLAKITSRRRRSLGKKFPRKRRGSLKEKKHRRKSRRRY